MFVNRRWNQQTLQRSRIFMAYFRWTQLLMLCLLIQANLQYFVLSTLGQVSIGLDNWMPSSMNLTFVYSLKVHSTHAVKSFSFVFLEESLKEVSFFGRCRTSYFLCLILPMSSFPLH